MPSGRGAPPPRLSPPLIMGVGFCPRKNNFWTFHYNQLYRQNPSCPPRKRFFPALARNSLTKNSRVDVLNSPPAAAVHICTCAYTVEALYSSTCSQSNVRLHGLLAPKRAQNLMPGTIHDAEHPTEFVTHYTHGPRQHARLITCFKTPIKPVKNPSKTRRTFSTAFKKRQMAL